MPIASILRGCPPTSALALPSPLETASHLTDARMPFNSMFSVKR
jgi:hypothetical protein